MRLINAKTLVLEEFLEKTIPPYAILSHRWEDGQEVNFAAFGQSFTKQLRGWAKIQSFCSLALYLGHDYCWVDTCCIDKSSSAELSEAINSMFQWYKRAEICIVYMKDVENTHFFDEEQFKRSEWFTRGWTLQELLAPRKEEFYDKHWAPIGSKRELEELITVATGIANIYLSSFEQESPSVAERLSWASKRTTSRPEDIAYCLLGLFDINMPLLYGEGEEKAFRRLQVEILNGFPDHSIFAWNSLQEEKTGILAKSPKDFFDSGSIRRKTFVPVRPYNMTNLGLRMHVYLFRYFPLGSQAHEIFALPLNCYHDYGQRGHECAPITIFLVQHVSFGGVFCRIGRYLCKPPKASELTDMQIYARIDLGLDYMYAGRWHGFVEQQARDPVVETPITTYWSRLLEDGPMYDYKAFYQRVQNIEKNKKQRLLSFFGVEDPKVHTV